MKKVFLDFTDEHSEVDPEYIELIKNDTPFYQDVYFFFGIGYDGQEYKLKNTDSHEPNHSPDITFKLKNENKPLVFTVWNKIRREQLLIKGTNWKENEQQSITRLEEIGILREGKFKDIIKKPIQRKTWDLSEDLKKDPPIFYAMLIDSDIIMGRCTAEFIAPNELDNYDVPEILQRDKEMKFIYISRVDIHPDYLGKRRCKPLVTFMIKSILSKLGLKSNSKLIFFIENASQTRDGIPACLCYTRAGKDSHLDVFYTKPQLEPMNDALCKIGGKKIPRTYYYRVPSAAAKSLAASPAAAKSLAASPTAAKSPSAAAKSPSASPAKSSKKALGLNPVRRRRRTKK
jgi:hypothetical protein